MLNWKKQNNEDMTIEEYANQVAAAEEEVMDTAVETEEHDQTEEVMDEAVEAEETTEEEETVVDDQPSVFGGLFDEESTTTRFGGNTLNKTQRLTQMAEDISREVLQGIADNRDELEDQFQASKTSHDAMDDLIGELYDLGQVDTDFLRNESEETLEKMIRSQQSKRSRAKSKTMTQDNYLTMMTGAVAELLLRLAAGKPKSAGGGAVMGDIGFSAEDIEQFEQFPEELKKAIRNIQSKKSIMKSKADFDIQNPRWQQLLRAEQQLKEVRDRVNGQASKQAVEVLQRQKQVEEMLAQAEDASPEDAKRLLDSVREMLASK